MPVGGIVAESNSMELPSIAVPSGFSSQNNVAMDEPETPKNRFIPDTVLAIPEEAKVEEPKDMETTDADKQEE
jgi:hypothetical protein